jgi:hypothetical protein
VKTIEVQVLDSGDFNVRTDGRETGKLTIGETLEILIALALPNGPNRDPLQWLKTPEEWEAWRARLLRTNQTKPEAP